MNFLVMVSLPNCNHCVFICVSISFKAISCLTDLCFSLSLTEPGAKPVRPTAPVKPRTPRKPRNFPRSVIETETNEPN